MRIDHSEMADSDYSLEQAPQQHRDETRKEVRD